MTELWWQTLYISSLEHVLNKVNAARGKEYPVEKCRELFDALNSTWNEFYAYREESDDLSEQERRTDHSGRLVRPDKEAFIQLLLKGLSQHQKRNLCESSSLKSLVNLTPRVMDHGTLRRHRYDPNNIPRELKEEAQREHSRLSDQFVRYEDESRDPRAIKRLLIELAKLLYVIRSNIAHGEKTTNGSDYQKVKRDEQVCQATSPLLELIVDLIFDSPSTRLAVYGTLAPGQPNESVLSRMRGSWIEGNVKGHVYPVAGLPVFEWNTNAEKIPIKLLDSRELPKNLSSIDKFEGSGYKRILIPVSLENNASTVANIYESAFV